MDLTDVRDYVLSKPSAVETYPFGSQPLVAKVGGKIFALLAEEAQPPSISLKCEPQQAHFLRDSFPAVQPGYHLNKEHWNTVTLDGSIPDEGIRAMIDDSYRLVVKSLTKAARQKLSDNDL